MITTVREMQAWSDEMRRSGKTIAFVPTMGYLHEGHLSLVKEGKRRADKLVISIFVNPTQFGPGEDLDAYPSDTERDIGLIQNEGADVVFMPNKNDLYGETFQTYVELKKLPSHLCGQSRPIHFKGVATVVSKLFNIVKPHSAVFGQKDYQQLIIIRQMVRDLNFNIDIVGGPIVREPDGLAMSSRNTYLAPEQRSSALTLSKSLKQAQELLSNGEKNAAKIIDAAATLISSFPDTAIDYISICDPETLDAVNTIERPALMALAVKVGKTRLIDNTILKP